MGKIAWAVQLGSYDDDAIKTLPAQLDLLRSLADVRNPGISFIYRLGSEFEGSDLVCRFQLICEISDSEFNSDFAEAWHDLASVGLIRAYGLSHSPRMIKTHARRVQLLPNAESGAALPVKTDWSGLVDQLRRRNDPVTIDLACHYFGEGLPQPSPRVLSFLPRVSEDVADFFYAVSGEAGQSGTGMLGLTATISSAVAIDPVFASLVGRTLFGVSTSLGMSKTPQSSSPLVGWPEELIRVWHAPYGHIEGRGGLSARTTRRPITAAIPPVSGVSIGTATIQGRRYDESVDVRLGSADRTKHIYIIGKTGAGKTNLMMNIARQDIASGAGGAVITPHPGLNEHLISTAGARLHDIVHLDFGDPEFAPSINPLTLDVTEDEDYELASEEVLRLIVSHTFNEYTGPVFEDVLRMLLASVRAYARGTGTQPSIPVALELLQSAKSREWITEYMREREPALADQWKSFSSMLSTSVAEQSRWVAAKLGPFSPSGSLRSLSATTRASSLSLDSLIDQRKILLVTLPESHLDAGSIEFLGSLMFSRLYASARHGSAARETPFFIHVDEFQRFVTTEVEELVAEARKFNVALTLAHQNLRQLAAFSRFEGSSNSRLKDSIFSNVGTLIAMKVSGHDVQEIAAEFQVPESAVRDIAQYEGLARAVIAGSERAPFSLRMPLATTAKGDKGAISRVRRRMITEGILQRRSDLKTSMGAEIDALRALVAPPKPKRIPDLASDLTRQKTSLSGDLRSSGVQFDGRAAPYGSTLAKPYLGKLLHKHAERAVRDAALRAGGSGTSTSTNSLTAASANESVTESTDQLPHVSGTEDAEKAV